MHNFNSSNEKIKLVGELEQNCCLVENAIDHLMKCKKQVEENAVEVKFQINGNATSALDALRKREVQLLRQVDVMQAQHLDLLQAHHAKLNQLMGNLKQSLHCAKTGKHDGSQNYCPEDLELAGVVQQQKIIPNSIGYIGESHQLISHIESFGKITAYYNFLASQHKQDLVSRCLPANQEDYGDCEHQLLFKTLEELKFNKKDIKESEEFVAFPSSNEGWLRNYLVPPKSTSWNQNFAVLLPEYLLVKEQNFWLRVGSGNMEFPNTSAVGKERHVQDWLRHLKQQDVIENVEYKISTVPSQCGRDTVATEASESIEMISMPEMSDVGGFTVVGSPTCCGANQMSWLRTVANKEQMKPDRCHCSIRDNLNVDIEDYVPCSASVPTVLAADSAATTTSMWLAKNNKNSSFSSGDSSFDVDFNVADVCCANELCRSPEDCVCVERCTQKALKKRLGALYDTTAVDSEWIRQSLSETMLIDENPKWLSEGYERFSDEKVEMSEKNLKMGSPSEKNSTHTASSVYNSNLVCALGRPLGIPSDNRVSHWLAMSSRREDGQMDCGDFLREDCMVYFEKGPLSNWLSLSPPCSVDKSKFIRDDFRMYFQEGMSNCWIQN